MFRLDDIVFKNNPIRLPSPKEIVVVYKAIAGNEIRVRSRRIFEDDYLFYSFTRKTGGVDANTYRLLRTLSLQNDRHILIIDGKERTVTFRDKIEGPSIVMAPEELSLSSHSEPEYYGEVYFVQFPSTPKDRSLPKPIRIEYSI